MQVVYYSILHKDSYNQRSQSHDLRLRQLIESCKSLRLYNSNIIVQVHTLGQLPSQVELTLNQLDIKIVETDDYAFLLDKYLPGSSQLLLKYPIMHKFLTLTYLECLNPTQVLYVDNDTFFHDDVNLLLQQCDEFDLYAREEVNTRQSHFGADSGYLDEERYEALLELEGCKYIPPINAGVLVMNNQLWRCLIPLVRLYLEYIIRFSHWLKIYKPDSLTLEGMAYLCSQDEKLDILSHGFPPLEYPSRNYWIREEFALWFMLGHLDDLSWNLLSTDQVLQGVEQLRFPYKFRQPFISHYFSINTEEFFSNLDNFMYLEDDFRTENAEVERSYFNEDWREWINSNLEYGVKKEVVFQTLLNSGFAYEAIKNELEYEPSVSTDKC